MVEMRFMKAGRVRFSTEDVVSILKMPGGCGHAQAYTSLPSGNWTFEVRATDGAGNAQTAAYGTYTWQLSLPAAYVALTGGDLGATVQRRASC